MLPELTASFVEVSRVREEYLRRRADVAQAHEAIEPWLDSRWRTVLTEVAHACDRELFYAVELFVVAASQLLIHEPVSDTLRLAKGLRTQEVELLEEALNLFATPAGRHHADPLVALVGHFSRNDVLFGARGYRRTILEAGRVAEEFLTAASRLGLFARPVYEFADRQMDEVVEADGIEVGTLILLDCGG
jgi:hypothetical protein